MGLVGLDLPRRPFYFKEAEVVVSCSYGPGRYDAAYEEQGHDYPFAYVRWTEQRNMQAVLDLMADGRLDVAPLITHRFDIQRAANAYQLIESGGEPYLGIVLQYRRLPCCHSDQQPMGPGTAIVRFIDCDGNSGWDACHRHRQHQNHG